MHCRHEIINANTTQSTGCSISVIILATAIVSNPGERTSLAHVTCSTNGKPGADYCSSHWKFLLEGSYLTPSPKPIALIASVAHEDTLFQRSFEGEIAGHVIGEIYVPRGGWGRLQSSDCV